MDKVSFSDRVRYWMDNLFAKGTAALIGWLAFLSLIIISLVATVVAITGIAPDGEGAMSFGEAFWRSLMRSLDAGTMGGDTGWSFRWAMLVVTVGGVFVISALIGVLSNGINEQFEELRKGRSRILETGHTVILGWSDQIFTILSELVEANSNLKRACIVVMGDHDKVDMEDQIRRRLPNTGHTHIICRTGSPIEMADLAVVSLNQAKAIIVPSSEGDDPDAEVIKTILAITNYPDRKSTPYNIVAEIRNPKNVEAARVAGNGEVEWIQVGNFIARIMAQTCRQSGLSVVYSELLDFAGDEIYIHPEPALVGKTFGESLACYETNTVMGLCDAQGHATLNPSMDTVIQSGDSIVLISADDDKIFYKPASQAAQPASIRENESHENTPEKTLVLGWNKRSSSVLKELDQYVAPGSSVLVVADQEGIQEELDRCCTDLNNIVVSCQEGDTTDRSTLESIHIDQFDHVMLLAYSDTLDVQKADARSLITLLHLRDMADRGGMRYSIVSEMLDLRNRNLADLARADDFVISDRLISLLITQVSEDPRLNSVFEDLFDADGSEVYLKPVERYVHVGESVNFYTVIEAAKKHGEVAIGYRQMKKAHDAAESYGVHLNPVKSAGLVFEPGDKIVVIAES